MISDKTKKWLERVDYDLKTGDAMIKSGRYIYAVRCARCSIFMCQQALEKVMKAFICNMGEEILPIHNLRRLTEKSNLINEIDEEKLMKLDFLSQYYINARYKEDIDELSKGINEKFSSDILNFTNEMVKWVIQKMN